MRAAGVRRGPPIRAAARCSRATKGPDLSSVRGPAHRLRVRAPSVLFRHRHAFAAYARVISPTASARFAPDRTSGPRG